MTTKTLAALSSLTTLTVGFLSAAPQALAAITNPPIGKLGDDTAGAKDGTLFVTYLVRAWNNIVVVVGIMVLFYFIWGAIDWISGAGEKGKIEAARNKMMNAFIGMLILISTYTVVGFVGKLFFGTEFDILTPTFIFNL